MTRLQIGSVMVTRLVEWVGPVLTVGAFFPDVEHRVWVEHQELLAPNFWNPADDTHPVTLQSWLVQSGGRNILVDTGGGAGKSRPTNLAFDHMTTDLPRALAAAGLALDDIDVVVNTHLHIDHVGWNTIQQDGGWTPTFRNATYLFPRADLAYFEAAGTAPERRLHIDDSVVPVIQAGRAVLYEETYQIDDHLTLQAAPGHTPGSSVVTVTSGLECAVFAGDVLHNPVQILRPDCNSCFCLDPAEARRSRRRLLSWAADSGATVLPAHFGGAGAARVAQDRGAFRVENWAPFGLGRPS